MPYEVVPRKRRNSWDSKEEKGISRLPIKLQSGEIKQVAGKVIPQGNEESEESDESEDESEHASEEPQPPVRDDVATGARFGRPAVIDVISTKSRKARIQAAKEQIASICQDIVADPENSVCSIFHSSYTIHLNRLWAAWAFASLTIIQFEEGVNTFTSGTCRK